MNGPSKITADHSSLVGLKAELLRKRLEVKEIKAKCPSQDIPKNEKSKDKVKDTHKNNENIPKVTETEDLNTLKKSKLMLEAKSRLYDKLQKSHSNVSELFLVDFSHKSDPEPEECMREEDFRNDNHDSDDDWIEYQDCFGRTRKCLREDLPKMQEKDHLLRQKISKEPSIKPVEEENIQDSPQREPEIEVIRRKWEEQTEKLTKKANIHYQDVLFDEARAHGVGYYSFSLDEEERVKQHKDLQKLREETLQKQKEMQELKEIRIKMEQNRLKVARIRQRIRAGLTPELPEYEDEMPQNSIKKSVNENSSNLDEKKKEESGQEDKTSEEAKSLAIIEDKVKAFGELLGKRTHWREMSQEEWVAKRRKDRLNEFAPMYNGIKNVSCTEFGNSESTYDNREVLKESCVINPDDYDDDSEIIGPLPQNGDLSAFIQSRTEKPLKEEDKSDDNASGPLLQDSADSFRLPCISSPSMVSSPPSLQKPVSEQKICNNNLKAINIVNSDRIVAGLRYLRAKFEERKRED